MTLSNALPIQFWLDGEESFNDKSVYGISSICFCQPWNCDDEINLQFQAEDIDDYSLNILNSEGVLLENIPFDSQALDTENYLSSYPLSGFTNEAGAGQDWTTGTNPTITVSGGISSDSTSDPLVETITGIAAGDYLLTTLYDASGLGSFVLRFYRNGSVIASKAFGLANGTDEISEETISIPSEPDQVKFIVIGAQQNAKTVTLKSLTLTRLTFLHSVSFTPTAHCNEQVTLQIQNDSSSPAVIEASSDCILLKESHTGTLAIDYSNNSNFNNLIYENISPSTTFRLRIPAIFFDEDNPAEQEDHELSNGEIVRLYNKLELKKRLDIGFMPAYMHQKLQLVLMHDNVTIEERQWIRRDAYEKKEGHRMFPLRRASVWLHDKDFIKENQL
jgi:hypothetical protein